MDSSWTTCWREELRLRKFSFSLSKPELLLQPQWRISPWLWLLYRLFMLLYTLGWCVYSGLLFNTPKWLIFLSHITYCFMGVYYLLAFCNLTRAICLVRRFYGNQRRAGGEGSGNSNPEREAFFGPFPLPPLLSASLRLQWCLHNLVSTFSLSVTLLYWSLDYPIEKHPLSAFNINTHVGNSVQAVGDLVLSSTPVHLSHCLHLLFPACLYISFTVLYWLGGYTNLNGDPYIYRVLDFGRCPLVASVCVFLFVFVCLPLSHFLMWNVYILRRHLVRWMKAGSLGICREKWWWRVGGGDGAVPINLVDSANSLFCAVDAERSRGVTQPLLMPTSVHQGAISAYL